MDDERDSIRAAETIVKSQRWRAFGTWLVAFVLLPSSGWVAAKLDTKAQVNDLSLTVTTLTNKIVVLTNQQIALGNKIDGLSSDDVEHPGALFIQRREIRIAGRNIVRVAAMALAHEPYSRQIAKRQAGQQLSTIYDNRVKDELASAAMEEVISTVAVP